MNDEAVLPLTDAMLNSNVVQMLDTAIPNAFRVLSILRSTGTLSCSLFPMQIKQRKVSHYCQDNYREPCSNSKHQPPHGLRLVLQGERPGLRDEVFVHRHILTRLLSVATLLDTSKR